MIATNEMPKGRWEALNLGALSREDFLVLAHDRVNHTVSGLFRLSQGGVPVEVSANVSNDTLSATAMIRDADGDVSPAGLLRLQEQARMARTTPSQEDNVVAIQATSFCPGAAAVQTVFDMLMDDISELLSDGRLRSRRWDRGSNPKSGRDDR